MSEMEHKYNWIYGAGNKIHISLAAEIAVTNIHQIVQYEQCPQIKKIIHMKMYNNKKTPHSSFFLLSIFVFFPFFFEYMYSRVNKVLHPFSWMPQMN